MSSNPYRGEAPFPEAGDGAFVCFTLTDMVALEEEYGEDFFEAIRLHMERASPKAIIFCLTAGLKINGPEGHAKLDLAPDDYPFALDKAIMPILDGMTMARTGMTYLEALEAAHEADKKIAQAESEYLDEPDPTPDLASSTEPEGSDTEQG